MNAVPGVQSASGEVDINVGLNAEDPSVAFLYVATFYEDSDYSDVREPSIACKR